MNRDSSWTASVQSRCAILLISANGRSFERLQVCRPPVRVGHEARPAFALAGHMATPGHYHA